MFVALIIMLVVNGNNVCGPDHNVSGPDYSHVCGPDHNVCGPDHNVYVSTGHGSIW